MKDGTMARLPQLKDFAGEARTERSSASPISFAYRNAKRSLVRRAAETDLPTVYGKFRAIAFETSING
jgi:3,4-dihydroxy 2-butanone 4-phosphate synthase/GTP cyclohydrolase II